eukprot:GFYU01015658.1.p1 GENE.GFYU01015658.1~~GFYU01015658.1.p1  ORF type:complete len:122 (-),score=15.44 GFYU01015658.1:351-716(-)
MPTAEKKANRLLKKPGYRWVLDMPQEEGRQLYTLVLRTVTQLQATKGKMSDAELMSRVVGRYETSLHARLSISPTYYLYVAIYHAASDGVVNTGRLASDVRRVNAIRLCLGLNNKYASYRT